MLLPGRKYSAGSGYRYGFNGQEKSDEVGEGLTTAMFWEYDSRVVLRWNVDPKPTASESPYLCFKGNPILLSDINGDKAGGTDDPPMKLDNRHLISGADFKGKEVNSVVVKPEWQSKSALEAFYKEAVGIVKKMGKIEKDVILSNGTTWNVNINDGHFYPVKGDGIVNLTKNEMAILRDGTANGAKGSTIFENIAKNKSIKGGFSKEMQVALNSLANTENVTVEIKLNGISPKVGTTVLFVLGAYQSAQTIISSPTPVKEAISETAGWGGASYGATNGALAWSRFGVLGTAAGTVVGGAMGYFFGKTTTKAVLNAGAIMSDAERKYNKSANAEGCYPCTLNH